MAERGTARLQNKRLSEKPCQRTPTRARRVGVVVSFNQRGSSKSSFKPELSFDWLLALPLFAEIRIREPAMPSTGHCRYYKPSDSIDVFLKNWNISLLLIHSSSSVTIDLF